LNRNKALAFYKRSVFLINPSFQLRFSLIVCSIIVISTLIYPVIIYDFFQALSSANPSIAKNVVAGQKDLIFFLILIQVVITLLVFIIFIFFTHKIAGPLYKLKNHLAHIREGNPISPLTFREGDYFHDVAEEVTLMLETVASNQESDFQYVEEISTYIENLSTVVPDDKKPILNEISRRLIDIKVRYKKSL
jgi:nitrogen fixation/metabolism regulation signal transduction histidine kinase